MSEMVERLARALEPFFCASDKAYGEHRDAARAVLKALREPTEAMVAAAWSMDEALHGGGGPVVAWQAMIDAALNEPDSGGGDGE